MVILKQADKLVKEGKYEAALQLIVKAREQDPRNFYAVAYEERVRNLLKEAEKTRQAEEVQAPPPSTEPTGGTPEDETATRAAALRDRIETILNRARELHRSREYDRALAELSRAQLLDPGREDITAYRKDLEEEYAAEAQQHVDEERKRQTEGEQKKIELLRLEQSWITREEEEKRQQEAEARVAAQDAKVREYLKRASELLEAEKTEAALAELAFIMVIDPGNKEMDRLEKEIRKRQEAGRQALGEMLKRKEEEHRRRQAALEEAIEGHIVNAQAFAEREKFTEALREIARGYIIDPVNARLQACESAIIASQEESLVRTQAARRASDEARRKEEEERLAQLETQERERVRNLQRMEAEARQKANQEAIERHRKRARQCLERQQYEVALGEVALAFLIDPFHAGVKELEEEILLAQAEWIAHEAAQQSHPEQPSGALADEVNGLIDAAVQLAESHEYARALDDIAKAFTLDPLNPDISEAEATIRHAYKVHTEEEHRRHEIAARQEAITALLDRVQQCVDRGALKEALTETDRGISAMGDDDVLLEMRSTIGTMLQEREEEEAARAVIASLEGFVHRARHYVSVGSLDFAREEVEKGLEVAPANTELQDLMDQIAASATAASARDMAERVTHHCDQARAFLEVGDADNALAEIALGMTIDPENPELTALETAAWGLLTPSGSDPGEQHDQTDEQQERERLVRIHLLAAEEFQKQNEFTRALDEVTNAYAIDPANREIRRMEIRIRQQELRFQENEGKNLKLIFRNGRATGSSLGA